MKTSRIVSLAFIAASLLTVTACANREYHYWQKTDPNTALYLTGVKAQQMLEQDIAKCVHEVIELTHLADVRETVAATYSPLGSYTQKKATQEMSRLPYWDVPDYIRDLRVDHKDYHDFDGCMRHEGWKRVQFVAPDTERRANQVYDATADYSVRPHNPVNSNRREQMHGLNIE